MPYDLANANQVKTPSSKFYSLVVEGQGELWGAGKGVERCRFTDRTHRIKEIIFFPGAVTFVTFMPKIGRRPLYDIEKQRNKQNTNWIFN